MPEVPYTDKEIEIILANTTGQRARGSDYAQLVHILATTPLSTEVVLNLSQVQL